MALISRKKNITGTAGKNALALRGAERAKMDARKASQDAVHNPVFESRGRQSEIKDDKLIMAQRAMRANSPKHGLERAKADARGYMKAVNRGGFQDKNGPRKPNEEDFINYKRYWLNEKPYRIKKK